MARPFNFLKDINDSKDLWKVAVKIKDIWTSTSVKDGKSQLEMVIFDAKGDQIQTTVPADLMIKYEKVLKSNQTYTFQNFHVCLNDGLLKATPNKWKIRFIDGTTVKDVNKHADIPDIKTVFKDFKDILDGKVEAAVLVDVIGVLHETGYVSNASMGKKIQVNFTLKDLSGNILNCTLWDKYALKFIDYIKDNTISGHTVIVIRYGKIKLPTDRYPLIVSNAWTGTLLYINDNLPEIEAFRKSIRNDMVTFESSQQLSSQSNVYSQQSGGSQFNSDARFLNHDNILSFAEILNLGQITICVTIGTIIKLKPTQYGWYYQACIKCPKATKGETPPFICADGHHTEPEIYKYKLDVEVMYEGCTMTFVMWDRECNEILGISANDLRQTMIDVGINSPLEYPLHLDNIIGSSMVLRAKWQPKWNSCSVQAVKEDIDLYQKIQQLLPSKKAVAEKPESSQLSQKEFPVFSTQSLSATGECDPDHSLTITPAKRTADIVDDEVDCNEPTVPTQLSSSKVLKVVKTE